MNWSLFDFILAGALLFGCGCIYILVARRSASRAYRSAVGIAVVGALALIWINGAVGIIGDENPANALYALVLMTGAIGATIVRLQPAGMAHTLFAMAAAQMLVPIVALIFWSNDFAPSVVGVFTLNALFASAFVISGLLFRRASETRTS
jgi:hypothetical protein